MARKQTRRPSPDSETVYEVRLNWSEGTELPTQYANQLFVSHAGPEFLLVFGVTRYPPRFTDDPVPKEMEIRPIARLAVTPTVMREIARAIASNLESYEKSAGADLPPSAENSSYEADNDGTDN